MDVFLFWNANIFCKTITVQGHSEKTLVLQDEKHFIFFCRISFITEYERQHPGLLTRLPPEIRGKTKGTYLKLHLNMLAYTLSIHIIAFRQASTGTLVRITKKTPNTHIDASTHTHTLNTSKSMYDIELMDKAAESDRMSWE